MKTRSGWIMLLSVVTGLAAFAHNTVAGLRVRVSVKQIRDGNGAFPTSGNYRSAALIQQEFDFYNKLCGRMGWGIQFDLIEVVALSGLAEYSRWFDVEARNGDNRSNLEAAAEADKSGYRYRDDAINVYVNNSSSGFCTGTGDVLLIGARGYRTLILHEIGHYLRLCHTQGCECSGCDEADNPPKCETQPGNDNHGDTPPDVACWGRDDIARWSFFNRAFSELNAAEQNTVNNSYQNVMSYHDSTEIDRFTHDQWEVMVDSLNDTRGHVVSGRTWFIDRDNTCGFSGTLLDWLNRGVVRLEDLPLSPFSWGTRSGVGQSFSLFGQPFNFCLGGPYKKVKEGIDRANPGDRLQIKAGNYNEPMRLTKALTLATDRGVVSIGRP